MTREIEFPFPLGGYDAGKAFARQPKNTTPSCRNVRAYDAGGQRGRGGSRPGLRPAYSQSLGGGVQWVGWLDCGYGDSAEYHDSFDYSAGPLSGNAGWNAAASQLVVQGGYVHLAENVVKPGFSSGGYQGFAGDLWDDFTLQANVEWNYATTGTISLWVGSGSGYANGMLVTVEVDSTRVSWPSP